MFLARLRPLCAYETYGLAVPVSNEVYRQSTWQTEHDAVTPEFEEVVTEVSAYEVLFVVTGKDT